MITVTDYDPGWPVQFRELEKIYLHAVKEHILSVEHVGSTSVPGLAAKPVLDIDLVISDENRLSSIVPVLAGLGYDFAGDLGIKDRYAFLPRSVHSPDDGTGIPKPAHNLYCCVEGSLSLNNHLLFRDALRNAPALAAQYGELKKKLARRTDDIDVYVASKSTFISAILEQNGISPEQVSIIREQNRKQ